MGFNPRARDGRERTFIQNGYEFMSFNPRARDGRERYNAPLDVSKFVSIHAPVMDANKEKVECTSNCGFNPRARDGREIIMTSMSAASQFQSTRP